MRGDRSKGKHASVGDLGGDVWGGAAPVGQGAESEGDRVQGGPAAPRTLANDAALARASVAQLQRELHDLRVRHLALERQYDRLREASGQLEEARARLADLYDFAPVVYLSLDLTGKIVAANLTAATIFGSARGSMIGRSLANLVAPGDRPAVRAHFDRCLHERIRVETEVALVFRGRPPLLTLMTSMPHLDVNEQVIGCKTVLTDISTLKWSQQKLELLTRASALLAATFATPTNLRKVVAEAVPALADLCVLDLLQPNGELRRVEAALADAHRDRYLEALRTTPPRLHNASASAWVMHAREPILLQRCAPGDLANAGLEHDPLVTALGPCSLAYVPILGRTDTLGVLTFAAGVSGRHYTSADLATMRDLAARVALAIENARLYEQAQDAIAARQDLLQFVSHDLRNPLMGVALSAEAILNAAPETDRRRSAPQIARIARAAKQMKRMIEDLLDYTAIDAGHLSVEIAAHSAREMIEDAADLANVQASAKRIALVCEVPDDVAVACDRHRVVQVLGNLVDNAIKFTPAQGRITMSAHIVGESTLFVVADTGPGIAPDIRPHVFERYRQAAATARQGRGLGLYIAKGLVEAQKGAMWVDSQEGVGTTFSFTLPLASKTGELGVGATTQTEGASARSGPLVRRS